MNWYKLFKIAQGQTGYSGSSPTTGDYTMEGTPSWARGYEITAQPIRATIPYQLGDKLRLRYLGSTQEQTYGTVDRFEGENLVIKWESGKYKGKETKHNINDASKLATLFQKVN